MTLFALALAWLSGIGLAAQVPLSTAQWLILGALSVAAGFGIRHRRSGLVFGALLIVVLGATRYRSSLQPPTPDDIRWSNDTGEWVEVTGLVVSFPDQRDTYTGLRVRVEQVEAETGPRPAQGIVLVHASRLSDWARFLLPLRADLDMIHALLNVGELTQAQVVVLAGSGYAAVNPQELFERVRPRVVVIPIEAENERGLPSPEVPEAAKGSTILRTDLNGWIGFRTDGSRLWVEVEHP